MNHTTEETAWAGSGPEASLGSPGRPADPVAQKTAPRGIHYLHAMAALVLVVAGLKASAAVMTPFALAVFVATLSLPALTLLRRWGLPVVLAVPLVIVLDIIFVASFGWLAAHAMTGLRMEIPRYAESLQRSLLEMFAWMEVRGVRLPEVTLAEAMTPERAFEWAGAALRGTASGASITFAVFLVAGFLLLEAAEFPTKLRTAFASADSDLARYRKIARDVQRYIAIKTAISLLTGVIIGLGTWWIGIGVPLFWGLLAFLLNYVPTIGSIMAAIPAVLVSLALLGPGPTLIVIGLYLGVNILFGNILEPALVGRRLGLSPVTILAALAFWGWVWGPAGMFLSVPLTMGVKIVLENHDDLRWAATLMGSAPATANVVSEEAA